MYIVKSSRESEHKSRLVDLVLETQRPEDWRASALCAGMDPTLFELPDNYKADDLDRMRVVIKVVCDHCPVKAECLEDADDIDMKFTIRGGILPGSGQARGRPRMTEEDLKKPRKKPLRTAKQYDAVIDEAIAQRYMLRGHCIKGHELLRENVGVRNHSKGSSRQGYCMMCSRESKRRRRKKWIIENVPRHDSIGA